MKRRGCGGGSKVMQVNVRGVQCHGKAGALLRGLDLWLGGNSCLLVFRQGKDRGLTGGCLDVWVTAELPCGERVLRDAGILVGHRQSCSKGQRSQSSFIIS